jgi:hypothetical protein
MVDMTIKEKTIAVIVSISLSAFLMYVAAIVDQSRHQMEATKTKQGATISSDVKAMPSLVPEAIARQ